MVEIIEAPPRSKLKRWDLVRIVTKGEQVDIAAMRAAAELEAAEQRVTGAGVKEKERAVSGTSK
jgi:small subunit ribosomal protein S17